MTLAANTFILRKPYFCGEGILNLPLIFTAAFFPPVFLTLAHYCPFTQLPDCLAKIQS